MKKKQENDLWFWSYEFMEGPIDGELIEKIYAGAHLYKIVKGAAWSYSTKLFKALHGALSTASDIWGHSLRGGEILQIFNFLNNHSKDFFEFYLIKEDNI